MPTGVTDSGFVTKSLTELLAEIEAEEKSRISPALNVSSASVIGQLNGIFASKLREVWELAEAVYGASYPASASGSALTNVASLTGTVRRAAFSSTVIAGVQLTAGTTLPAGSIATVAGNPSARFALVADVTNGTPSTAVFQTAFESEATGPVAAPAGLLTVIATPVSGWLSVTNALDATLGANEETDAELRARRDQELRAVGGSTIDSIRTDLLAVSGVTEVSMFENTLDIEVDGMPPKSIEAVVLGGTDSDVAVALWGSKPGGIETHGVITQAVADSRGALHDVSFSRPLPKNVYLVFELTVDPAAYGPSGDDAVKAAVVALEASLHVGDDVLLSHYYAPVLAVPGVLDVLEIRAGFSAAPVGTTNLVIGPREIAALDTSRVAVER